MDAVDRHQYVADDSFDGGDLDCGGGLLFLIRKHLDPLPPGKLLEIKSTETSVDEELPAWCRLTKNDLVSWTKVGRQRSFLICKGKFDPATVNKTTVSTPPAILESAAPPAISKSSPAQVTRVPEVLPLSVMGIGSWPRPNWLIESLHAYLEGTLPEDEFQQRADDAVKLAVSAQLQAGVDVITDGEQRRDNYSSFVATRLENCQLVPLTDLLPLVDDPDEFAREMQSLDVPADKVRHPAILGRISRRRSLALHEFEFLRTTSNKPIKVALPGPYLLTRTMWMDCISDKVYQSREELSVDIVKVLREEIGDLLQAGVSIVQLDEPVLTEVVFTGAKQTRSFMCGALSERGDAPSELEFARQLIEQVIQGLPSSRLAMHICRGNWTTDESVALSGDYRPLLPMLKQLTVGTLFLEFCTPRAGDLEVIKELPDTMRLGIGVVNPKNPAVETLEEVLSKSQTAIDLIGQERILLTPDCGFATFADNPVCQTRIAEQKLKTISLATSKFREG